MNVTERVVRVDPLLRSRSAGSQSKDCTVQGRMNYSIAGRLNTMFLDWVEMLSGDMKGPNGAGSNRF